MQIEEYQIYQACYGKPFGNWEMHNVSAGISASAVSFFERAGGGCTPQNIGEENLKDAEGNPLCLYEFLTDEHNACVLKAQYGEVDSMGRPKMYAHGFLADAVTVQKDPNILLSIADANFRFSAEQTKEPPEQLVREPNRTACGALAATGLNHQTWIRLLECVQLLLESTTDFPLYVCCDCSLATVKNLIYCILYALPYSQRVQLSFFNANYLRSACSKRILFVKRAPSERDACFDLSTGNTNLPVAELENDPDRSVMLRELFSRSAEAFRDYFDALQQISDQLGFSGNASPDQVNLAAALLRGTEGLEKLEGTEFVKYLLKLLIQLPEQNLFAENYLSTVLELLDRRDIIPVASVTERLIRRRASASSDAFIRNSKKLCLKALIHSGAEAVSSFLDGQYQSGKDSFFDWSTALPDLPGGLSALYAYYRKRLLDARQLQQVTSACSELDRLLGEKEYRKKEGFPQAVYDCCMKIGCSTLCSGNLDRYDFAEALSSFGIELDRLIGPLSQKEKEYVRWTIQSEFWKNFNIQDFSFQDRILKNCSTMLLDGNERSGNILLLIDLYHEAARWRGGDLAAVEFAMEKLRRGHAFRKEELPVVLEKTEKLLEKRFGTENPNTFFLWMSFAALDTAYENPLDKMAQLALPILCDAACFEAAFQENTRMQKSAGQLLDRLLGDGRTTGAIHTCKAGADTVKTLKKNARVIQEYQKQCAAEEKERQKKLKKEEKKQGEKEKIQPESFDDKKTHEKTGKGLFGRKGK